MTSLPQSIPGVIDVERHAAAGERFLLIEIPHGATRKRDYDAVLSRLRSPLPALLEHFFFVNTDIGAPEGAAYLGRTLSAQGIDVTVARCLIPRTFIDTNRVLGETAQGVVKDGLTPGMAAYISAPEDKALLIDLHQRYTETVNSLYAEICGAKRGLALQLHSYSPRSVGIEVIGEDIVEALHKAYLPEVYATWPERPAVDLITALEDKSFRAAPALADALLAEYAKDGIAAKENATYHMHPVTSGYAHARDYPDQVICVELNRGLVAEPFVPFGVSPISEANVARMVAPIGRVLAAALR